MNQIQSNENLSKLEHPSLVSGIPSGLGVWFTPKGFVDYNLQKLSFDIAHEPARKCLNVTKDMNDKEFF